MDNSFDKLQDAWDDAKRSRQTENEGDMLELVRARHNDSKKSHIWNIVILLITVIGLCAFFYYLAPLQDTLSRFGIGLMIGGLILRILIELVSHNKARSIDYSQSSLESTRQAQNFYQFRKRIHGPVTLTIIGLYVIGFYMLTPEFARYFSTFWMWAMDIGFLVIAAILFFVIRKGVVREMEDLRRINQIEESMQES